MQDAGLAVQMRVHLREDPEGGVPRHALGAWSGAQRRSAAAQRRLGGRYPMCTREMVERRAPRRACAGEIHGTQTEQLHDEKAEEVQKQPAYERPEADIWCTW